LGKVWKTSRIRRTTAKRRCLGLSIVKKIIEGHGQEIWLNSEEGKGSAFIFSLKAAKKPDSKFE
jgi:signal transduction histidine kinase